MSFPPIVAQSKCSKGSGLCHGSSHRGLRNRMRPSETWALRTSRGLEVACSAKLFFSCSCQSLLAPVWSEVPGGCVVVPAVICWVACERPNALSPPVSSVMTFRWPQLPAYDLELAQRSTLLLLTGPLAFRGRLLPPRMYRTGKAEHKACYKQPWVAAHDSFPALLQPGKIARESGRCV